MYVRDLRLIRKFKRQLHGTVQEITTYGEKQKGRVDRMKTGVECGLNYKNSEK
jgi:hypothetical protein